MIAIIGLAVGGVILMVVGSLIKRNKPGDDGVILHAASTGFATCHRWLR